MQERAAAGRRGRLWRRLPREEVDQRERRHPADKGSVLEETPTNPLCQSPPLRTAPASKGLKQPPSRPGPAFERPAGAGSWAQTSAPAALICRLDWGSRICFQAVDSQVAGWVLPVGESLPCCLGVLRPARWPSWGECPRNQGGTRTFHDPAPAVNTVTSPNAAGHTRHPHCKVDGDNP